MAENLGETQKPSSGAVILSLDSRCSCRIAISKILLRVRISIARSNGFELSIEEKFYQELECLPARQSVFPNTQTASRHPKCRTFSESKAESTRAHPIQQLTDLVSRLSIRSKGEPRLQVSPASPHLVSEADYQLRPKPADHDCAIGHPFIDSRRFPEYTYALIADSNLGLPPCELQNSRIFKHLGQHQ